MWSTETLNDAASRWVELAWTVVWQSTILAAIVALVVLAFRRSSPEVRYWLWQIVAIKLLLMPFWTVAVPVLAEPDSSPGHVAPGGDEESGSVVGAIGREPAALRFRSSKQKELSSSPNEPVRAQESRSRPIEKLNIPGATAASDTPERPVPAVAPSAPATDLVPPGSAPARSAVRRIGWQAWFAMLWSMVALAQVIRMLIQRAHLRRLLSTARPADPKLAELVAEAAAILRLARVPRAVLIDQDGSPFVCGVLRPLVVTPVAVREALSEAQLRQVLLHELAHVKRRDLLWGWIPEIARTLYFFHPVAHWVCSGIRLERELACDRLAMAASGANAGEYADTLVRAVSFGSRPVVLQPGAVHCGCSSHLSPFWKRRIAMLPVTRESRLPRRKSWLALVAAGILVAAVPTLLVVSAAAQPSGSRGSEREVPDTPAEKGTPSGTESAPSTPKPVKTPYETAEPGRDARPGKEPAPRATELDGDIREPQLSSVLPSSGVSLDLITLANSYVQAVADLERAQAELEWQQTLLSKKATSQTEFRRADGDLRHAKLRADLLDRIIRITIQRTKRELDDLQQQEVLVTRSNHKYSSREALDGTMRRIWQERHQARTRLEILEAILSVSEGR